MEFADVNWTVIAIAVVVNVMAGYLIFDFGEANSIRDASMKESSDTAGIGWRYLVLVLYSVFSALFLWFLFLAEHSAFSDFAIRFARVDNWIESHFC